MTYKLVLATDNIGAIGKDNKLLWEIPEDLKHFKTLTENEVVVMGRKTFESLPFKYGLPNRHNYVLSRKGNGLQEGGKYCIINSAEALDSVASCRTVWVIGGAEVYNLYLDKVDEIHHTLVDEEFTEADTFVDMSFVGNVSVWKKVSVEVLTDKAKVIVYKRIKD